MKSKDNFDIFNNNFFFRDRKIKHINEAEQGDSFVIAETEEKVKLTASFKNFSIIFFIFLFFFVVMIGRLFFLQIYEGKNFRALAEGNRIKTERLQALRGIIYDSNAKSLVKNNSRFSLLLMPNNLPTDEAGRLALASKIAPILIKTNEEVLGIFNQNFKALPAPYVISDKINYEQAMILDVKIANEPSLVLEFGLERSYLGDNQSLAHVLGYVGQITQEEWQLKKKQNYRLDDYLGKSGLEGCYEEILKGSDGFRQIEVDALGERRKIIQEKEAQAGEDLYLSIDSEFQARVSNILKSYQIKKAAVVALDPMSGAIKALVSFPEFDNNLFIRDDSTDGLKKIFDDPAKPLFNRVIMAQYPSGSTFKPVVAVTALEQGIITEQTRVLSTGGIKINQWFFPDWKTGGHGLVNVTDALAESVNTFFYYIGGGVDDFKGLGVEKIVRSAQDFGLGKNLGLDLPGEKPGFLPSKDWKEKTKGEKWYIGDTYHLAIGQGDILVTPLQVTVFMATIVNGGILYQPHLVSKIVDPVSKAEIVTKSKVIRSNFVNQNSLNIVKKGLRQAVTSGSAVGLSGLPVKVGAKTGTAQAGGDDQPHAWLTAFGPFDQPEIVLTVIVENGGEGSAIALPIARDILNWYFGEKS